MCDFSTAAQFVRPAKKGEELVVFKGDGRFATHRMLVSPDRCDTAVCVRDNTKLRLVNLPEGFKRKYQVEEGTFALFTAVEEDKTRPAHDLVILENGAMLNFQDLPLGTRVLIQVSEEPTRKGKNDVLAEEEELVPVRVSRAF
jgi:hypothetical protein